MHEPSAVYNIPRMGKKICLIKTRNLPATTNG